MAQFTIYRSTDGSAPVLTGAAGSLIALFKACLVDGYGAKAAAGWTQPVATASNIGSFKQGSSSYADAGFVLNDNGPNVTSTYKEAWATGWRTVSGVGAPVGSGTGGQFPTAAQLLTTGHVVVRKSTSADATARAWMLVADDRTVYFFARTGDFTASGVTAFNDFAFGEFYSVEPSGFTNACFILGRNTENVGTNSTQFGGMDRWICQYHTSNHTGQYFMDSVAGGAGSQLMYYSGDASRLTTVSSASTPQTGQGNIPLPNGPDSSYYIAPITLSDAAGNIRGRLRGIFCACHATTAIADGTTVTGAGDYAGRTFLCIYPGTASGGLLIETSNTVDTN